MHLNIDRSHLQLERRLALRTFFVNVSVVFVLCFGLFCHGRFALHAAAATPPAVTVTEQDNGKTIDVVVGQKVLVQLPSNPTTGYQWKVLGNPAPLEFVKSNYEANSQAAGRMGAGGTQILRFASKSSGKVELKLGYVRPWEKDVTPAKTFTVTIAVK